MLHVVFVVNGFQDLVITGLERERRKPARSFNKMKLFGSSRILRAGEAKVSARSFGLLRIGSGNVGAAKVRNRAFPGEPDERYKI
jgi:hypothetical protein